MSRKLTAETGRGEKIHLSVDGEYIATTNKTFWYSLGLSSPCQVEEDQLQEILDRVQDNRMYEKALDLLTQRDYSHRELSDKLVQKEAQRRRTSRGKSRDFGVTDASYSSVTLDAERPDYDALRQRAEDICLRLEEAGLLNDERFARSYAAELLRRKHLSTRGLKQELRKKGVARETADIVVEELAPDPAKSIRTLLQTKYRTRNLHDEKDRRRTVNALLRLGYTYGEINNAISEFSTGDSYPEDLY